MNALISERDGGFNKPSRFMVCRSFNERFVGNEQDGFAWLSRRGWLRPLRGNVRYYSRFKTRQAAIEAAKKAGCERIIP